MTLPHTFDGTHHSYQVRLARPDDEAALRAMLEAAAPDDIRLRFFLHVRHFPHEFIVPLTENDGQRRFALIATRLGTAEIAGSAMMVAERDGASAEFGIFVARGDADQRLGSHLLRSLVALATEHGIRTLHGVILRENWNMIDLVQRLGFTIGPDPAEPGCVRAELVVGASVPTGTASLQTALD